MCLNAALDIPDPIPFYKNAGPNKIDPATIPSTDALLDATVENYKWVIHRLVLIGNITDALYQEYAPRPFLSTLIDECIHRSQDVRDWNYRRDYRDLTLFGLNTVADSLAAIKKVVFDDKKVSMGELIEPNGDLPRKQRYTVNRMWSVLCGEGFSGGYTTVKDAVRELRRQAPKRSFIPVGRFP